mgnify:CR=1 FL=1
MPLHDLSLTDFETGQILLIDKPLHWSSYQAVNAVKWGIKTKFNIKKIKVGHAGTLDPLATGLLIICTGKFTKKIAELQGQIKTYTGLNPLICRSYFANYVLPLSLLPRLPVDQSNQ